MDIWERLHNGDAINMTEDEDFRKTTLPEMGRSLGLCSKINLLSPYEEETRKLIDELFAGKLPKTSNILAPMEIDFGCRLKVGDNTFINHSFCVSAAAGIQIDECVQIAPQVTILTVNHDLKKKEIVKCLPVHIKKGAWIGARSIILPGVTIGENSVVGAGSVVTKDVPDNTVVVGNPARILKTIAS